MTRQCVSALFTPSKGPGDKFGVSSAIFSHDGRRVITGDMGGSIKIWNSSGTQTKSEITISNAHAKGNAITSIQLSVNNFNLISRSMDDTLKLWDIRNSSKAIAIQSNLEIFHEETNCIYSPNEKFILTGTASREKNSGYICVFNSISLEEEGKVEVPSSCVSLLWPSKMEQLFCGLADGSVKAHYDPQISNGGVILPILNASKKLAIDDYDKFVGNADFEGEVEDEAPSGQSRRQLKNEWTKKRNMTKPGLLIIWVF